MTADVNVTEKVARAIEASPNGRWLTLPGPVHLHRQIAHAALAVLSDPEVLAGIAAALREHDAPTHIDGLPDDEYDCCAAAVVEWLRGQG